MAISGIGNSNSISRGKEFAIEIDQSSQVQKPSVSNNQEPGFADNLKDAISKVNTMQKTADTKVQELVTGQSSNIHETMIAVEKADIALKLMTQVRNKIIDAYQEVMKMQV